MMNNLNCPKCGGNVGVIDSRSLKTANTIRRRRICFRCEYRYSTYEVDADTYNILLKVSKNIGVIRSDLQYLLDKLNILEVNINEQFGGESEPMMPRD